MTAAIVDNPGKSHSPAMLWDIFCKVIDNHGDIGVCWRLSAQLAERGEQVRLWVDDASALHWMAPDGHAARRRCCPGTAQVARREPGDVGDRGLRLRAGAGLPGGHRGRRPGPGADSRPGSTSNTSRRSRSRERSHGLPSPVLAGPAAGLTKHFFYPGFTPAHRRPVARARPGAAAGRHSTARLAAPAGHRAAGAGTGWSACSATNRRRWTNCWPNGRPAPIPSTCS